MLAVCMSLEPGVLEPKLAPGPVPDDETLTWPVLPLG